MSPQSGECSVPVLYGLRSCDTCRKARRFLDEYGVNHRFHDLREQGVDAALVEHWLSQVGPDALLNRRSTTWRQLDDATRERFAGPELQAWLAEYPTLIKRPVLQTPGGCLVGFDAATYRRELLHE